MSNYTGSTAGPRVPVTVENAAEAVWLDRNVRAMTQPEYAERRQVPRWVVSEWEIGRIPGQWPVPEGLWNDEQAVRHVPLAIALRFERWRRRITMAELGALLGVSRMTINNWERLQTGYEHLARAWGLDKYLGKVAA